MSTTSHLDRLRDEWLECIDDLIRRVKSWADELDWATRIIEVSLSDPELGKYKAPALLIQENAIRILLEPIARSAPGAEGVVDLYLMPAYDDIASLYLHEGEWHVHYMFPGTPDVGDLRDAEARPLTREALGEVLGEMKKNAG